MLDVQIRLTEQQILGALLWEIANGRLDDDTAKMTHQLDEAFVSSLHPNLMDIVKYIWGMN